MIPVSRRVRKTIAAASLIVTAGVFALIVHELLIATVKQSITERVNNREHLPEPPSYEIEDLFYHEDLVGKDMTHPAVITVAKEALIPPPNGGPLFLDNPMAKFYSQHKQDEHVVKIFNKKKGGFFFEVGALTGEKGSNTLHLERDLGWTGILMEPTPISYHLLKSKNRKSYIMRACLGTDNTYSEPTFNVRDKAVGNSLLDSAKTKFSVKVPCYPFYSILAALGNPVVDYMSLDVEGVEMKVLKSIPWHLVKIRVMTIEIFLLPEGPDAVRSFMEEKGFKFIKKLNQDFLFINLELSEGLNMNV